jgi:arginyl-tRNA--protein-N-Asp/Glu arginylyltransferase
MRRNHGAQGKGWIVSKLKKSVLDVKVGKFVILGRAKKTTQKQKKLVRAVKSCEKEEEKLECWRRYAKGDRVPTHAIGIKVEDEKPTMLIDNGIRDRQSSLV